MRVLREAMSAYILDSVDIHLALTNRHVHMKSMVDRGSSGNKLLPEECSKTYIIEHTQTQKDAADMSSTAPGQGSFVEDAVLHIDAAIFDSDLDTSVKDGNALLCR